jgi:hypothetical protein
VFIKAKYQQYLVYYALIGQKANNDTRHHDPG